MRTQYHPNWALLSALLALAIGLLVEQAANDRWLWRTALLLIVYGSIMIGQHIRPVMRTWRDRIVRTIQFWRSGFIPKSKKRAIR